MANAVELGILPAGGKFLMIVLGAATVCYLVQSPQKLYRTSFTQRAEYGDS